MRDKSEHTAKLRTLRSVGKLALHSASCVARSVFRRGGTLAQTLSDHRVLQQNLGLEVMEDRTVLSAGNEFAYLLQPIQPDGTATSHAEVAAYIRSIHLPEGVDPQLLETAFVIATQAAAHGDGRWDVDRNILFAEITKHPRLDAFISWRLESEGAPGLIGLLFGEVGFKGDPLDDAIGPDVSTYIDNAIEKSPLEMKSNWEPEASFSAPADWVPPDVIEHLTAQLGSSNQRLDIGTQGPASIEVAPTLVTVSSSPDRDPEAAATASDAQFIDFVPPSDEDLFAEDILPEEGSTADGDGESVRPPVSNSNQAASWANFVLGRDLFFELSGDRPTGDEWLARETLDGDADATVRRKTPRTSAAIFFENLTQTVQELSEKVVEQSLDVLMTLKERAEAAAESSDRSTDASIAVPDESPSQPMADRAQMSVSGPSAVAAGVAIAVRYASRTLRRRK